MLPLIIFECSKNVALFKKSVKKFLEIIKMITVIAVVGSISASS